MLGVNILEDLEVMAYQKEDPILYDLPEPSELQALDNRSSSMEHIRIVRETFYHFLTVRFPLFNGPAHLVLIILPTEFRDHSHHFWKGYLGRRIWKLDLKEVNNVSAAANAV